MRRLRELCVCVCSGFQTEQRRLLEFEFKGVASDQPRIRGVCVQGALNTKRRAMPPNNNNGDDGIPTIKEPILLQPKTMRDATGEKWVCMIQLITVEGGGGSGSKRSNNNNNNKCYYLVKQVRKVFLCKAPYGELRLRRLLEALAKPGRHPFKRVERATRSRLVALGKQRGERLADNRGTAPLVATAAHIRETLRREGFAEETLRQLDLAAVVQVPHDTGEDTPLLGRSTVCTRQRRTSVAQLRIRDPSTTTTAPPGGSSSSSSADASDQSRGDADYQPHTGGGGGAADDDDDSSSQDDSEEEEEEEDPITRAMRKPTQNQHTLPTELPSHAGLPRLHIRSKLALDPAREASQELQRHMKCFEKFCRAPLLIGREGSFVSATTWKTCKQELAMFLGFCATHMDIVSPTLETVLDGRCLETYFASRAQAKLQGGTLSKGVQACKRVVRFWKFQRRSDREAQDRLLAIETWLADLDSQFLKMPKKRTEMPQQQERGEWPTYQQLVVSFATEKAEVLAALTHVEGELTRQQARRVHDALLCCMMIGWVPPPRISAIITVVGPEPADARCALVCLI